MLELASYLFFVSILSRTFKKKALFRSKKLDFD
jgi:hypothetical protein